MREALFLHTFGNAYSLIYDMFIDRQTINSAYICRYIAIKMKFSELEEEVIVWTL